MASVVTGRTGWTRRAALAATAGALARPALAQERFPSRPLRLIVPWSAGGSADGQLRVLAELAGQRLGQPVVVENRPGATGTMGAIALKDARPDGYLLSQIHMSVFRTALLAARPNYDPLTDFSWIIQVTGSLLGIVVRAESPWRTLPELIADAKTRPGRITYGTLGIGSGQHIAVEQLSALAGIEMTHVPYRGTAETLTALTAGQIDVASDSSAWAPMVQEGRFRLLCVLSSRRAPRFPEAPTLRELGIPYVSDSPYGIAGPRGLDPAVVRTLHDAFRAAMGDPRHAAILVRFDQPDLYLGSEDYARAAVRYVEEERETLRRLNLLGSQGAR